MSSTLANLIAIEGKELGYRETGDNHTIFGAFTGAQDEPWCASFQSWCLAHAGIAGHSSASAQALVESFPTGHTPRVGALAGFHMPGGHAGINHVGLVIGVSKDGRYIKTREGNTSNMVADRTRSVGLVVCFGYPTYASAKQPKPVSVSHSPASQTPRHPLFHTRLYVMQDTQGWNATIGTKRQLLHHGGTVAYLGEPVMHNGAKYVLVAVGRNQMWARYGPPYTRWI